MILTHLKCYYNVEICEKRNLLGLLSATRRGVSYDFRETMTPDDIPDGASRVTVQVTLSRMIGSLKINVQHRVWKS